MTILIPEGTNQYTFYNECKQQGMSVRSRYAGVCLNETKGYPYWMARHKGQYIGRFPLTEEGEQRARQAYVKFLESNNIEERYFSKRTRNTKQCNQTSSHASLPIPTK
jgi:hypothetical protein